MKILLGVIIGVAVLSFLLPENTVYGIWVPQSPQELLNNSDTIFVGNITSVNTLQLEKEFSYTTEENGTDKNFVQNYTIHLDQYHVNVEEFLKNPQNSSMITVRQPTIPAGTGYLSGFDKFNVGDHVLFYVQDMDGNNTYSPESFVIPEYCAGKDVLTQERFEMGNEFFTLQNGTKIDNNFTANVPIQFVWNRDVGTLAGKNFDVLVYITKSVGAGAQIVFNKEIHVESTPCQWVASAKWEFTPQEGEYGMDIRIQENGTISHLSDSEFSVKPNVMTRDNVSPLKQFKSGIALKDITCAPDFQLVIKAKSRSPACVKPDDVSKLVDRGWADKPNSLQEQVDFANVCLGMNDACRNPHDVKNSDPFGITALIIYHPPDVCLNLVPLFNNTTVHSCPPNKFYLKINSNSTAYLMGYNICDDNSCATNNDLSSLLPLNTGLHPDYQMIGLPVTLPWKYNDTVEIQLYVSPTTDNKTVSLVDLDNSTIVP